MRFFALLALFSLACQDYNLNRADDPNDRPGDTADEPDVHAGPQPDIEVEPASLNLGGWPLDCKSDLHTVTVRNVGEADLHLFQLELVGDGHSMFRLLQGGPETLAPNAETTFQVDFTATAYGDYEVAVQVTSSDPDEGVLDVPVDARGSEDRIYEESFRQNELEAVDVLFVVDNSCSMSDKVERLKDSFRVFIGSFATLGLDYQIGVTTTDMDATGAQGALQGIGLMSPSTTSDVVGAFAAATNQGSGGSADEKGLAAMKAALSEPLISSANKGLVRDDAQLAVVVVSDEDDSSSGRALDYATFLDGYKGGDPARSSFSVVGGGRGLFGCSEWVGSTLITATGGPRYPDVADATGGMDADICALDFDEVLEYLSYYAAGLVTKFPLAERPSGIGGIKVWIDGVSVPYNGVNGWTYVRDENAIEFHGASVPAPMAYIDVAYPVPTECR